MRVRILGPVEIDDSVHGRRVLVNGQKRRALLAALVVRAGHIISTERLIAELWGETPPANAVNALQAHIKRLRNQIEVAGGGPHRIVTRSPGYLLTPRPAETDAEEFHDKVAQARTLLAADPDGAIPLLRNALSLWRGPALDGCVLGDICAAEAIVLEEHRLAALEALYDASLRANRHGEIVGELEETSATYPLRERFYDQLMIALYRSDRQSDAIGVYDRARRTLLHELGVEPGPALRATMQAILSHSPGMLATEPASVASESAALSEELAVLQHKVNALLQRQEALLRMAGADREKSR